MLNNKRIGTKFEKEFANLLGKKGYFVTMLTPKTHTGVQPFDLIACKNNIVYCFECKTLHSKYKRFPLSRIEENQRLSFKRLQQTGNTNYYVIINYNNQEIYKIPFAKIDFRQKNIELIHEYTFDVK